MIVRAKAGSLCIEEDDTSRSARPLEPSSPGDAVGNITPFGPIASEGAKALLSRRNLATSAAFSSVLLENIFYSISVAIMVTIGILAFLLGYRPPTRRSPCRCPSQPSPSSLPSRCGGC